MRATTVLAGLGACVALVAGTSSAHAEDLLIGSASAAELQVSDGRGGLESFGTGGGFSILFAELDDDVTAGFELSTLFLRGAGDERLYDLGLGVVVSMGLEDHQAITPFITFGLDLAAAVVPPPGEPAAAGDRWVSLGVHGGLGVHGFLGKCLYWRAQAGWLGAGVGGVTAQVSLGYVVGD